MTILDNLCPICDKQQEIPTLQQIQALCDCPEETFEIIQRLDVNQFCACVQKEDVIIQKIDELCKCPIDDGIPVTEYDIIIDDVTDFCLPNLLMEMNTMKNCNYRPKGCK